MSFIKLVKQLKIANETETIIINNIIKNSKKIVKNELSLTTISKESSISHSSTSRLIKKVGFKNWNAFIQSCMFEESVGEQVSFGIDKIFNMQVNQSKKYIIEHQDKISQVVKIIQESKNLLFFGERECSNIAQNLAFLFSKKSNLPCYHVFFLNALHPFLKPQTTFFILKSSDNINYDDLIKRAYQSGCKIILIRSFDWGQAHKNTHVSFNLPIVSYALQPYLVQILSDEAIRYIMYKILEKI